VIGYIDHYTAPRVRTCEVRRVFASRSGLHGEAGEASGLSIRHSDKNRMSARSTRVADHGAGSSRCTAEALPGRDLNGEPGGSPMELRLLRFGFAGFATFGSIQLANAVGTKFKNAVRGAVLLILASANGNLYHHQ
jgi:hypothetical protein